MQQKVGSSFSLCFGYSSFVCSISIGGSRRLRRLDVPSTAACAAPRCELAPWEFGRNCVECLDKKGLLRRQRKEAAE